jgi:monoamine oxidase
MTWWCSEPGSLGLTAARGCRGGTDVIVLEARGHPGGRVEQTELVHGKHAPPFYVCGSDQWVCGYMEGAVRTGSAAAEVSCR